MSKVKRIIVRIPIIGYCLRLIMAAFLLPRHVVSFRHAFSRHEKRLDSLEAGSFLANRQIIELQERLDLLEQKHHPDKHID